ncbi:MAG: hypothetical protein K2N30_00360, partial [Clostridia bacterium]|nr:hypothetical protein [Clostridia bacterium]
MINGFFTYKNLAGEYPSLENDIRLGTPTAVFGVADYHKYLIASLSNLPVLYVAPDTLTAQRAYEAINTLSGKKCVFLSAKDDVILYKDALSKDALYRRICAVYGLLHGADIAVCEADAIMQLFPADVGAITFKKGEETDYAALPQLLVKFGYTREYSADNKG